jgi:hypothetical protein
VNRETFRSARRAALTALSLVSLLSCGGTKQGSSDVEPPDTGSAHGTTDDGAATAAAIDAGVPIDAAPPASAITFVLTNTGREELALNLDYGWGAVLQAFYGKPPHAKPILMFPTFCTAACDAPDADRCMSCPRPEKVADIRNAQKLEKIAPGASLEVPWDANVHAYQVTKPKEGKIKKCKCFSLEPAPAQTYTVRACGLRLSTSVEKSSRMVCAEGQMTLPVTEPTRVELSFAK